jgi:hypothetical protein
MLSQTFRDDDYDQIIYKYCQSHNIPIAGFSPPPTPVQNPNPKVVTHDPSVKVAIADDPDLACLVSTIRRSGKFRLKNKMVHLTYPCQFDEATYLEYIKKLVATVGNVVEMYSIVKEFGKRKTETGEPYPHLHAAFRFVTPIEITNPRFFDYKETPETPDKQSHCHIGAIRTLAGWAYICETYHKKDGIPFTDYRSKGKTVTDEELQACKTAHDVYLLAVERGILLKVGALLKAWEHCRPPPLRLSTIETYYPWQQYIANVIDYNSTELSNNQSVDDRVVIWISNEEGSMGKSAFANDLVSTRNACVITTTNTKDAICAVGEHMKKYGEPQVIILDIARSTKIGKVYEMIEVLKDRQATNGKYKSESLNFNRNPTFIVFSNEAPDTSRLSADRWSIHISDYNGQGFDYSFLGKSAKVHHERYIALEKAKQQAAITTGKIYNPCVPFRQAPLDVDYFVSSTVHLPRAIRKSYWDRHLFPVIKTVCKPGLNGHTTLSTVIETQPMTAKEIEDYKVWCQNTPNYGDPTPKEIAQNKIHDEATAIQLAKFMKEQAPKLPDAPPQ